MQQKISSQQKIPPPPEKPAADDCCASGCVPCVFDYYELRLIDWEERYQISLAEYLEQMGEQNDEAEN